LSTVPFGEPLRRFFVACLGWFGWLANLLPPDDDRSKIFWYSCYSTFSFFR
jgi:hypothetical protein